MTLKDVMNVSGKVDHALGSLVTGGVFAITSIPSLTGFAEGKGIHRGDLRFIFAGGSSAGFVDGSIYTQVTQAISPTAIKAKADGDFVIRAWDPGTMNCLGVLLSGGSSSVVGLVEVASAGQSKVSAQ